MIVACPTCKAVVDAKKHGEFKRLLEDESGNRGGAAYVVGECPKCGLALFAREDISVDGEEEYYSEPKRLWPSPPSDVLYMMPQMNADECRQYPVFMRLCFLNIRSYL